VQEESEEPAGTSLSFTGRQDRFKNCERKSAVRRRTVAFRSTFQVAALTVAAAIHDGALVICLHNI
jgi:hypothetical protein